MARFFIGSATHKLDGKGRVSLPSAYRDVLRRQDSEDEFVLVPRLPGKDHHIALSRPGHERLIKRLGAQSYPSEAHKREMRRLYIAEARAFQLEDGGRFVLPKDLRDMLGLTKEAQFVGDGETFQIWEPGRYAEVTGAVPEAEIGPVEIDLAGLVE